MSIIKNYHDKKWTLQFLDALYNSIDIYMIFCCCRHTKNCGNMQKCGLVFRCCYCVVKLKSTWSEIFEKERKRKRKREISIGLMIQFFFL
jgi:hypothetical protein